MIEDNDKFKKVLLVVALSCSLCIVFHPFLKNDKIGDSLFSLVHPITMNVNYFMSKSNQTFLDIITTLEKDFIEKVSSRSKMPSKIEILKSLFGNLQSMLGGGGS